MKKLAALAGFLLLPMFFGGCIEDGPLPGLDEIRDADPVPPPDVVVLPSDAMVPDAPQAPEYDAAVPAVDASMQMPDAEVPDTGMPDAAPAPPSDAAPVTPDAARLPVDAYVLNSDASCEPPTVDAAIPAPIVCHGLRVRFSSEDVARMHHCTGWMGDGSAVLIPPATGIYGADGVCAITCNNGESGETALPSQCSGVWLPGATADVPRWYTPGCRRLPDHPPAEPDQAGCTWDRRCDLY
jgi:hypothetical protein